MAGRRGDSRVRKRKERPISTTNSGACLYLDSEAEVERRFKAGQGTRSKIIRELVSKALYIEKLEEAGHDVTQRHIVRTQQGVVNEGIAPLVVSLNETKNFVETGLRQMQGEYASIEERLKRIENALGFIIKAFDRVLQNIVLIRALIWVYVFEFYYTVMVSAGKKLTPEQLNKNFSDRVKDIRIEATKHSLSDDVVLENTVATVAKNLKADATRPPALPSPVPTRPAPNTTG